MRYHDRLTNIWATRKMKQVAQIDLRAESVFMKNYVYFLLFGSCFSIIIIAIVTKRRARVRRHSSSCLFSFLKPRAGFACRKSEHLVGRRLCSRAGSLSSCEHYDIDWALVWLRRKIEEITYFFSISITFWFYLSSVTPLVQYSLSSHVGCRLRVKAWCRLSSTVHATAVVDTRHRSR